MNPPCLIEVVQAADRCGLDLAPKGLGHLRDCGMHGDERRGLPKSTGYVGLRLAEHDSAAHEGRDLRGGQAFPLDVLDHLIVGIVGRWFTDHGGNGQQASMLCGAEPTGTIEDAVPTPLPFRRNDDRLPDTTHYDRGRKFVELGFTETLFHNEVLRLGGGMSGRHRGRWGSV